jgi:hypothetical protein
MMLLWCSMTFADYVIFWLMLSRALDIITVNKTTTQNVSSVIVIIYYTILTLSDVLTVRTRRDRN